MSNEFASRCGIYCGDCEYREKLNCSPCQVSGGKPFWGTCELAKCSISKGIENCSQCSDFPCDLLNKFAYDKEQGDNGLRISNLREWKKLVQITPETSDQED